MDNEQIKEMKDLLEISLKILDNDINHSMTMEKSFKLQAQKSKILYKQQERLIKQLRDMLKPAKVAKPTRLPYFKSGYY